MSALALQKRQPLLVQLPNGALVPAAGAQIANGGDIQIAGANPDSTPYTSGAFGPSDVSAAGDGGVGPAAAIAPDPVALGAGHSGSRPGESGALIDTPKQNAVMYAKGADTGPSLGALMQMAAMKKAAAGGGGDGGGGGILSKIFGGSSGNSSGGDDGGGILDKLKGLFLGGGPSDGLTGNTVPSPGAVSSAALPPIANDSIAPNTVAPAAGALGQGESPATTSVGALIPSNPTADVPTPRPRPPLPEDREGAALSPSVHEPNISLDDIHPSLPDAGHAPTFFESMRADPLRMALFLGGLKTMGAASRPGATPLGALGEGLGGGFESAFAEQGSDEDRAMADRKQGETETNDAAERAKNAAETDWYKQRPDLEREKNQAAIIRANAYAKYGAGKGAASPTALMKNAQFYVDAGVAPDLKAATTMLRSSVNDAATYQRLVQAEKKVIQSTPEGATMNDSDIEGLAQQNVQARASSAMSQQGALGAAGGPGSKGGGGGGALGSSQHPATPHSAADLSKLPKGAVYINPADGKPYKKK